MCIRDRARAAAAGKSAPVESAGEEKVLDFSLDEVREAHLVPVINFKGRSAAPQGAATQPSGSRPYEEADGGRTQ